MTYAMTDRPRFDLTFEDVLIMTISSNLQVLFIDRLFLIPACSLQLPVDVKQRQQQ